MPKKKFVPRQRKHKVLDRQRRAENYGGSSNTVDDSNAVEIIPASSREKEKEKARLRAELHGVTKVSAQKKKRLDKYIESKLRKDENRELQAKLAKFSSIDTSLLESTKNLGRGRQTNREQAKRALQEQRAGLQVDDNGLDALYRQRPVVHESPEAGLESKGNAASVLRETQIPLAEEPAPTSPSGNKVEDLVVQSSANGLERPATLPSVAGSGLKRPLELDGEGRPVLRKRRKRGGVVTKLSLTRTQVAAEGEEDSEGSWEGFSDGASRDNAAAADSDNSSFSSSSPPSQGDEMSSEETSGEDAEGSDGETGQGDDDSDQASDEYDEMGQRKRPSVFKVWAQAQINKAQGYEPVAPISATHRLPRPENFTPRAPEQDALPQELQPTAHLERKAFSVPVVRTADIQDARLKLPVVAEEQKVMEAIHNRDVVIVCGATGSGKTTQVPQFLYEAGYGYKGEGGPTPEMIGITQPRRVAAVSMSERVSQELGDHGHGVGYQIRFDGNVDAKKTAIKFMTDGVLLRELSDDPLLQKYSVIIIDEAHERSANTDILVGMLSRVTKVRRMQADKGTTVKPLKLVIMSATLRIEDMTQNAKLFPEPPPVVDVEGRQYPVTLHFSRQTHHDYVEEAFKKICRGHRKLPPGAFLVFLTGRNEILDLIRRLRKEFNRGQVAEAPKIHISSDEMTLEAEDIDIGVADDEIKANESVSDRDDYDESEDEDEAFVVEDDDTPAPGNVHILPLYSQLPTHEQLQVFRPPPEGSRLIVVATNVAETSLTIPGVRYVFDCGRSKDRHYDKTTGVQTYKIGWISKASANQRSGRAGRTGPGHCYRLYSSALYERDLPEFTDPEILRMPLDSVVLQLKSIAHKNMAGNRVGKIANFPFPTPPGTENIEKAERTLEFLGALSPQGQVTKVGNLMSLFPLPPRLARIILVGHIHDCIHYAIALAAALSVQEIFVPESQAIPPDAAPEDDGDDDGSRRAIRERFFKAQRDLSYLDDRADALKMLVAVRDFPWDPTPRWCEDRFLRFKALQEAHRLRRQLTDIVARKLKGPQHAGLVFCERLHEPSDVQCSALRSIVAAGFFDQLAIRADLSPTPPQLARKPTRAIDVAYRPLMSPQDDGGGGGSRNQGLVYVHPSSLLARLSVQELPKFVVYSSLQRSSATAATTATASNNGNDGSAVKTPKTRMMTLTDIGEKALAGLVTGSPLVEYGKPLKPADVSTGPNGELWRVAWFQPKLCHGREEWPLPAAKFKQQKNGGRWVTVKKL